MKKIFLLVGLLALMSRCRTADSEFNRKSTLESASKFGEVLHDYKGDTYFGTPSIISDSISVSIGAKGVYWLKNGLLEHKIKVAGFKSLNPEPAVLKDDTIVVGTNDGFVRWLKDGVENFQYNAGGPQNISPLALDDGTVIASGGVSLPTKLIWLKDAKKIAEYDGGGTTGISSRPVKLVDNTIVVAFEDGTLRWIKEGKLVHNLNTNYTQNSPFLSRNGDIVAGDDNGKVNWFRDGKLVHDLDIGGRFVSGGAELSDNTIVFANFSSNKVFWIKDKLKVFEFGLQGGMFDAVRSTPLVNADDSVIVLQQTGELSVLKNGMKVASTKLPSLTGESKVKRLQNGKLVVGGERFLWLKDI